MNERRKDEGRKTKEDWKNEKMEMRILIVGAGPAGSSAAIQARKAGGEVLIVEKKREIGRPVECAEFIPALLLREVDMGSMGRDCIAQRVEGIKTYIKDDYFKTIGPGYIINRDKFDNSLVTNALKEGAILWRSTLCKKRNEDGEVILLKEGHEVRVKPEIIIGADGPKSTVGRWIDSVNNEFISALQYKVLLKEPLSWAEVYFREEFVGGYGWLFPKGDEANLGVACKNVSRALLNGFFEYLRKIGKVQDKILGRTGGIIPVNGPLSSFKDNVLLVGDACGMTHPITGGGITQAIITGNIAGEVAARTIKGKDSIESYSYRWQELFGQELRRAKIKRRFMEAHWDDFESTIKKCWVAFKEYYET